MSTVVNFSTSLSVSRGFGEKNRKYTLCGDRREWKATRLAASSGPIGRTCTGAPSESTTSVSHVGASLEGTGGRVVGGLGEVLRRGVTFGTGFGPRLAPRVADAVRDAP